jgi:hypothetical protein
MNDILINNEGDLIFENGDFAVGNSEIQNQLLLLYSSKGDWKEHPDCGVTAYKYIEDFDTDNLARSIDDDFTGDGMKVSEINIDLPDINIEAEYGN